jgi:NTP pyrophosphatase (non-canonical NTP hydrolase)
MDMKSYQREAQKTAIYGVNHAVIYPALGLAGEAGEVANKVKKMLRDGDFDRQAVAAELGDCLWYIAAMCRDLNMSMGEVAMGNLEKLMKRKAKGTIKGSGDNR